MLLYSIFICIIICMDQLSKIWVVAVIKPMGTLPIIKDVLHLTYSENTGAAFSILKGKQIFLVSLTTIAMVFMIGYLYKWTQTEGEILQKVSFALIIGGGIGNLIDRVRLNYVIDFVDFRLINFAIFNVADSCIVVGCIVFAGLMLFKKDIGI